MEVCLKDAKLLIVDDEPGNLRILVDTFQHEYALSYATNGKKALELAESIKPDLILLDIMMPGMDGYEVIRQLKENPSTQHIPVIFATALRQDEDEQKGLDLGAVDYVVKPFRIPVLKARVKNHLYLKRATDQLKASFLENRQLLHILCHDLSNPLFAVHHMVDIMESMDPKSRAYCFKVMKSSTKNGIDIIEMVRNLRAIDEGKAQLFLGPVNLHKAVKTSVDMLKVRFDQKKVSVHFDVEQNVFVHADQTSLINSVINNLLTNALKFSHADSEVLIRSFSHDDDTVSLSVKDNGIGMPSETIDVLFDLEKSASRKGTQDEKGTGFGMPLMKKFLNIYGATVEIRSKCVDQHPDAHGTEFLLTFSKAESKKN